MVEQLQIEFDTPPVSGGAVTLAQLSAAWHMRAIIEGLSGENSPLAWRYGLMIVPSWEAAATMRHAYQPTGARSIPVGLVWRWPFRDGGRRPEERRVWGWACPGCGSEVVASAGERATPEQIASDARCWPCRKG